MLLLKSDHTLFSVDLPFNLSENYLRAHSHCSDAYVVTGHSVIYRIQPDGCNPP